MKKNERYCVGSNMRPALYIGQKEPVIIGTKIKVQEWIDNFFNYIYNKNENKSRRII